MLREEGDFSLSTQDSNISIHLSGCQEGLQALQKLAKDTCANACLDNIHFNRIVLALDELFANIHEHGYANQGGEIECSACWIESQDKQCTLEIELRDYAPAIADISKCRGVCPETLKDNPVAGGLGMNLIHATTSKFEHTPLADGNRWRLVFDVQQKKEEK